MQSLTLDAVKAVVPAHQRKHITQEVLDEVHKLANDPEYGQEFLDLYMGHLDLMPVMGNRSKDTYMNALKFFSKVEGGSTLVDAYIMTFPERCETRWRNAGCTGDQERKELIGSEASRYNRSKLVNDIRNAATVPVQLIHRHILHEAILEQAKLMKTARREDVRQAAAACLIRELKPAESHTLNVEVKDGAKSAIEDLVRATEQLARAQRERVIEGTLDLKDVAEAVLVVGDEEQ